MYAVIRDTVRSFWLSRGFFGAKRRNKFFRKNDHKIPLCTFIRDCTIIRHTRVEFGAFFKLCSFWKSTSNHFVSRTIPIDEILPGDILQHSYPGPGNRSDHWGSFSHRWKEIHSSLCQRNFAATNILWISLLKIDYFLQRGIIEEVIVSDDYRGKSLGRL